MTRAFRAGLDRWQAWHRQSVNRGLFAVMATVGSLTIAVKLVTLVKEAVVARQFGTGDALDVFLIAMLLPQFAISLVGGSLNVALIPTFIRVRAHSGEAAARRLFASVSALSLTALLATAAMMAIAGPIVLPFIASGFPAWKLAMAESAFRWLLPTLVITGVTTTWGAILNAEDRFALAAAAPAATSLAMIVLVVVYGDRLGVTALIAGTVGGAMAEAVLLGWGLARRRMPLLPRWHGVSSDVRHVVGQYAPAVAGAFLMGGTAVVSQSMASMLDPGSVAALIYGGKLPGLMLNVIALAVSTAALPSFSRLVATGDLASLHHSLRTYARLLLYATVPLTLVLIVLSYPLVVLFLQRGAFTADDSRLVAWTQAMYLLQVPFVVVGTLFVRVISAFRANRILMWGSLLNLIVSLVLTRVLMQVAGVIGIALANSLMLMASVAFLWTMARRVMRGSVPSSAGPDFPMTPTLS